MRYWLLALVLSIAAAASAQALPLRDFRTTWSRGAPKVAFSAKDLADERVRQELTSGLRKRLVVTVSAHLKSSNWTIVTRRFGCDITHDLWADGYIVRVANLTERLPSLDRALDRCLVVDGLFVGEPHRYKPQAGKDIYFTVRAEFNPISSKQCRELIRPSGGDDPVGPLTANIVRRRICRAERTIVFRSKSLQVPK